MSEARGGVLFIDEAYGLLNNSFGKEAIEALLANLTQPDYHRKLVVILAGYPDQMERLLNINEGMPRRFTGRIIFAEWSPVACAELVRAKCQQANFDMPSETLPLLLQGFADLACRKGFGSAGDATVVADAILEEVSLRDDALTAIPADVVEAELRKIILRRVPKSEAMSDDRRAASSSSMAAAGAAAAPPMFTATRRDEAPVNSLSSSGRPDVKECEEEAKEEVEQTAESRAPPLLPELLWASLDSALRAKGYGLYKARVVLTAAPPLPDELLDHISRLVGAPAVVIAPALHAQCGIVLERVLAAIREEEAEAERVREAELAIERANEAERVRLREAEEARKRARLAVYICGVCGRVGCPVMPLRYEFDEGSALPSNNGYYNGRPAFGSVGPGSSGWP
jgi:hypothetical protein